jgi:acetate kinase
VTGPVLVVNAGSTSLKLSLVDDRERSEWVETFHDLPPGIAAVGHRVVHGGSRFREPLLVDERVAAELEALEELAPLHNTPALVAIREARRLLPDVPHVAVFDTAFHATLPEVASTYALPRRFRKGAGIRRYGFHGLSVEWATERVRAPRLVVCHLGGGCSVTAVRDGRSVDTTMGFTPLEGVPMATRSGSVDPGAILHLLRTGTSVDALEHALEHESGLLGLSGSSGDVRELEASGDPSARLALDLFAYRVAQAVGAMAVTLGGLDALVFTAGVGEHSVGVRERICDRLAFLGVELHAAANLNAAPDAEVAPAGATVRVVVLQAREDVVIARVARKAAAGRPN